MLATTFMQVAGRPRLALQVGNASVVDTDEMWPRDRQDDRDHEQPRRLPLLLGRETAARRTGSSEGPSRTSLDASRIACPTHVGKDKIFQADLFDSPGRIEDRALDAYQHGGLTFGVARLDHLLAAGQRARVARGPLSR